MTKLPQAPGRTTTGFAFSILDRAVREGFADRRFGKGEMRSVLEFFSFEPPECVFCGSKEVRRWDHLIPIRKGGDTVLGNMVPSCSRCDDSKQDLEFEAWMTSDARYSPASLEVADVEGRILRIKEYVSQFDYSSSSMDDRINDDESRSLGEIRIKLNTIRTEIEDLISTYRDRTDGN